MKKSKVKQVEIPVNENGTETPASVNENDYVISLNKQSLVNFKKSFYLGEKIEQYQYVSVDFNPEEKVVTFNFYQQKQKKHCYKILHRKTSGLFFAHKLYKDYPEDVKQGKYPVELKRLANNKKYYTICLKEEACKENQE